jgi:hypothetical protein
LTEFIKSYNQWAEKNGKIKVEEELIIFNAIEENQKIEKKDKFKFVSDLKELIQIFNKSNNSKNQANDEFNEKTFLHKKSFVIKKNLFGLSKKKNIVDFFSDL